MASKRKRHSGEFKAKVALEALKGLKTVNELAAGYGVHPPELDAGMARYFRFYNQERPHEALGYRAPAAVHGVVK